MNEQRFRLDRRAVSSNYAVGKVYDNEKQSSLYIQEVVDLLNEQQEQLDLYKEAILTMLGLLADKGIIFSGVKDE